MPGTSSQHDVTAGDRMIHIPDVIPIFPLPKTVLLPGEVLPLHVFEERYRNMARDAIAANRVIGICQVAPGFEHEQPGNPPIERVGCVGFIGRHEQTEDGRFLIWLFGLERFEIEEEMTVPTLYRQARVNYGSDDAEERELARLQPLRRELRGLLPSIVDSDDETRTNLAAQLDEIDDSQLIAVASQLLSMPVSRKRQLLDTVSPTDRFLLVFEDLYSHLEQNPNLDRLDTALLN